MHPDQSLPAAAAPTSSKVSGRTPRAKPPRQKATKTAQARSPSPAEAPATASASKSNEWGELGDRFRQMILDDEDVWLRILRYEVRPATAVLHSQVGIHC